MTPGWDTSTTSNWEDDTACLRMCW